MGLLYVWKWNDLVLVGINFAIYVPLFGLGEMSTWNCPIVSLGLRRCVPLNLERLCVSRHSSGKFGELLHGKVSPQKRGHEH